MKIRFSINEITEEERGKKRLKASQKPRLEASRLHDVYTNLKQVMGKHARWGAGGTCSGVIIVFWGS
jgi:hypothetical protein